MQNNPLNKNYAFSRYMCSHTWCPVHLLSLKIDYQSALLGMLWQYFSTLSQYWSSDGFFFPVPGYHIHKLLRVSNTWLIINYNWPGNNALIHYLLPNKSGYSFSCSLPAILPKSHTIHLLGNPNVAAGVSWAAHKSCKLCHNTWQKQEVEVRGFFYFVTASLTDVSLANVLMGWQEQRYPRGRFCRNKSEEL